MMLRDDLLYAARCKNNREPESTLEWRALEALDRADDSIARLRDALAAISVGGNQWGAYNVGQMRMIATEAILKATILSSGENHKESKPTRERCPDCGMKGMTKWALAPGEPGLQHRHCRYCGRGERLSALTSPADATHTDSGPRDCSR